MFSFAFCLIILPLFLFKGSVTPFTVTKTDIYKAIVKSSSFDLSQMKDLGEIGVLSSNHPHLFKNNSSHAVFCKKKVLRKTMNL